MAQAKSGFSTEGTQYTTDKAYYLLDTVPGSGSVIEGPVTITGNLTTTGSETIQGSLSVAGNITAPGVFQIAGAAAPLALVGSSTATGGVAVSLPGGSTGAITLTGAGTNSLVLPANGNISLTTNTTTTPADRITIANTIGPVFNGLDISGADVRLVGGVGGGGRLSMVSNGSGGVLIANTGGDIELITARPTPGSQLLLTNQTGPTNITVGNNPIYPIRLGCVFDSANGVQLVSGLLSQGASGPGAVIPIGVGLTMASNKGFFSTDQSICIVVFPGPLSNGNRGVAIVQRIAGLFFSPLSVIDSGTSVILSFLPGATNSFSVLVF